ncbi:hypothetical protein Tco_0433854, partial [Tanacetum coccineum]
MSALIVEEEIVEPAGEDSSAVHDFYYHMSEVRIDRIVGIETVHRRLEVRAMLDIERDRVNSLRLHMSLSQEEF